MPPMAGDRTSVFSLSRFTIDGTSLLRECLRLSVEDLNDRKQAANNAVGAAASSGPGLFHAVQDPIACSNEDQLGSCCESLTSLCLVGHQE